MGEFEGKVVFITGGTSGIGRGTAIEFGKKNARVAITGRREKEGFDTVKDIQAVGGEGLFIKSDVSSLEDVRKAVKQTIDQLGPIEIASTTPTAEVESSTDPRQKSAYFIVEQDGEQLASLGKLFDSWELKAFVTPAAEDRRGDSEKVSWDRIKVFESNVNCRQFDRMQQTKIPGRSETKIAL